MSDSEGRKRVSDRRIQLQSHRAVVGVEALAGSRCPAFARLQEERYHTASNATAPLKLLDCPKSVSVQSSAGRTQFFKHIGPTYFGGGLRKFLGFFGLETRYGGYLLWGPSRAVPVLPAKPP